MKLLPLAIITALTAGFLLLGGTAEARATRYEFTGTQTCIDTSPGEVTFHHGNMHVRGATSTCDNATTLPDGNSVSYAVANANLDSTGSGPIWGTSHIETTGGTVYEGTFRGTETGGTAYTDRLVAKGLGPLKATLFVTVECHYVMVGVSVCDISGYLLVR